MTREKARAASAAYLNSLSRDELFTRFEITRVAKIDGLDVIGVPVYSSARPVSRSISVQSGKSRTPELARAGAIAEAIEFWRFEHPVGPYVLGLTDLQEDLPTRAGSDYKSSTLIDVEPVTHFASGRPVWFPSEMLWMAARDPEQKMYFMASTNGQALGSSFEDAFLTGLYEVVERDQVGLWRISMTRVGGMPPRVKIPEELHPLWRKCQAASLKLYLFDCRLDIQIPVYMAQLVDPYGGVGSFCGWGCHLSSVVAAERAILEAIQARCVYISGARDDILRHEFISNRERDPGEQIKACTQSKAMPFLDEGGEEISLGQELAIVLSRLSDWRNKIYYKCIPIDDRLCVVKTHILGLEHPNISNLIRGWRSTRWEIVRLEHQARGLEQISEDFLKAAGIRPGMTVIDCGCGAGDLTLILSRLVGPKGRVIGIDANPEMISRARERVGRNVQLQQSHLEDCELRADAIVGRLILMHLKDPVGLLLQCEAPIIAFQEADFDLPEAFLGAGLEATISREEVQGSTLYSAWSRVSSMSVLASTDVK